METNEAGSAMKVLVVDDNKDGVELLSQILEDDCSIVTAYSGQECLIKAAAENPDLILLDVNMSKMDGYETMQKLQLDENCRKIPVVFVSAYYTESSMVVKGLEQGAFDYLIKPVDEDILLAKIRVVKRIKHAEDQVLQQKDELQAINDQLESADKLKSIFLASMSHELRTPLNSIIGFTSLMLMEVRGEINEAQRDQLSRVKRNANHLLSLINDVLDISKIESGKFELAVSSFDLVALVDEVAQSISPDIQSKSIRLIMNIPVSEIFIESDSRRVRQILSNLMSNAAKFTEKGSVTVSLKRINDHELSISVKDTGIGIQQEKVKLLFEPFQQADMSYTRNFKGTGLGLYLCDKLSSMIGGRVLVDTKFGVGSQFTLILPISIKQGLLR